MALTDFLGKDIGGYAQGPMPDGSAGIGKTGINWSQIMQGAMQQKNRPLGSVSMPGMMGQQQPGVRQVPPMMQPVGEQRSGNDMGDLKEIMKVGAFLFGFGA